MAATLRVGILTCSDKGSRGEREDTAGPAVAELLGPLAPEIVEKAIVPDDPDRIAATLEKWSDGGTINCLLTTGGTGLGPRDNTPEATRAVIEREVPGLAEVMRQAGLVHTPMAALSRGLAGVRGDALVEKCFRDVKVFDIFEGTGEVQRIVLARRLFGYPRT